ncbi:TetR family transcriptional regulator [Candidatus Solincola sp.]|nr:TetR family transcriptional regulator C-terminal domain-containing protein [Actinomycetota bacterium]MDI7253021.1 TetR family transcriptional regulator C-terminal domain-containing protein [Actinomycetota bacterium]
MENFYAVLKEEGLEGASIAKVASRMGIHPSLTIHYFSNKEEMVVELVDYILHLYEETFLPTLEEIEDPEERLERTLDIVFGEDWNRLVDTGVFYACYSLGFRNRRVREIFLKMYGRLREVLEGEIAVCMEKYGIDGQPAVLADYLITLIQGYDFYRSLVDDDRRFDELSLYLKESALRLLRGTWERDRYRIEQSH